MEFRFNHRNESNLGKTIRKIIKKYQIV